MPAKQLHHVLETELGSDWRSNFTEFHDVPIAAASIGQVHHAVLPSGQHVAVKVQYPGVADSIDSDLDNLERLVCQGAQPTCRRSCAHVRCVFRGQQIAVADVFPKGFYIDNIIQVPSVVTFGRVSLFSHKTWCVESPGGSGGIEDGV